MNHAPGFKLALGANYLKFLSLQTENQAPKHRVKS